MQGGPQQGAARGRLHAPIPPKIPQNNVQSLIPRLTTTINDIDSFKSLLAQGAENGTMPNWDITLQRYAVLLGRITALSQYISQPPPSLGPIPSDPSSSIPFKPALSSYLAHPLRPLPSTGEIGADQISPFAPDVYFQVLNTLPIPQLSAAQDELLPGLGMEGEKDRLRKMDERELGAVEGRLVDRLKREKGRAKGLKGEIEGRMDEVDWVMRVDEEEEGEDGSLFGDDEDEDEDEGDQAKAEADVGAKAQTGTETKTAPNPREGWTIQDYVKFMETGIPPAKVEPEPEQPSTTITIE